MKPSNTHARLSASFLSSLHWIARMMLDDALPGTSRAEAIPLFKYTRCLHRLHLLARVTSTWFLSTMPASVNNFFHLTFAAQTTLYAIRS